MTYFSFPFRWVMLRMNESRGIDDERLFSLPAPLDNDILLATWTKEMQTFNLEQCKCFTNLASFTATLFGYASCHTGLINLTSVPSSSLPNGT